MVAFSIWNAIWVVFVAYVFISILILLFLVLLDLFRDKHVGGFAKFLWVVLLLVVPLLGLLIYVLARGHGMSERSARQNADAEQAYEAQVREAAVGKGLASELQKASDMHAAGTLSDDEFAALKTRILA